MSPVATGTATIIIMTDPASALLRLMAWLSPAFPTGAFAYSHGLEWAIEAGDIGNEDDLHRWLSDLITLGTGWSDTILLRHAHRTATDADGLRELAEFAVATAASRERCEEAVMQGRAFVAAARAWHVGSLPDPIPYAVAVGAIAGRHAIPEDETTLAYLHAFVSNLISAAVRLIPLGQSAGLRVLAAMEDEIRSVSATTAAMRQDDVGGCAFRSDLASMRHETQYTRLFRS